MEDFDDRRYLIEKMLIQTSRMSGAVAARTLARKTFSAWGDNSENLGLAYAWSGDLALALSHSRRTVDLVFDIASAVAWTGNGPAH